MRATMRMVKGLGTELSLKLYLLLKRHGPLRTAQILQALRRTRRISQPTVTGCLKRMVRAGILRTESRGSRVVYAVRPEVLDALQEFYTLLKQGSTEDGPLDGEEQEGR